MAIYPKRWLAIKPLKFFGLRLKDFPKRAPQQRVVKQQRVLASAKKFADALMFASKLLWNARTSEVLRKIDMQADVESGRLRQVGRPFRVLHEHHGTGRIDSIGGKARHDSIRSECATAKIISVYGKHELTISDS